MTETRLAWWSAGLPFGLVEVLDRLDPKDEIDYICISHNPESYGKLVICTEMSNVLYVVAHHNFGVLFLD